MTLDDGAIAALAALMNVSAIECRRILISTIHGVRPAPAGAPLRPLSDAGQSARRRSAPAPVIVDVACSTAAFG